jgi:hypothetical protein
MANSRVSSGIGREWARASSANAAGNLQHSRPFFIPRIEVGYLRLSYCRGNARMSAGGGRSTPRLDRTGTNTLARYGRIRAGREYSAPGLCVECRLSRSPGAIKYRLVADEGADCDGSKKERHRCYLYLIEPIACGNNLRVSASYILWFSRACRRRLPRLVSPERQII